MSEVSRRRLSSRESDLIPRVPGQQPIDRAPTRVVIAVLFTVALFFYCVRSILLPFVVAGAIAFVCTPVIERVRGRTGLPRGAVATLVFALVVGILGFMGWLMLPSLAGQVKDAIDHLHEILQVTLERMIGKGQIELLGTQTDAATLANRVLDLMRSMLTQSDVFAAIAATSFATLFGLILTIVLLFYFLSGGPVIARGLVWLVPPAQRSLVEAIWDRLSPLLLRYFAGVALVTAYAMVAAYIGLGLILHIDNALVLSMITGIAEVVPIIGPATAIIIVGLAAIRSAHDFGGIMAYAVYATTLRLSIDQVLSPLVLGSAGRVHPTLIIFCFFAGGVLFGIVGVILAIPVALTIKTVLATLYEEPADDRSLSST